MANWLSPTTQTLLPDWIEEVKSRDVDVARMFDSGTFSNIPQNSLRFNVDSGVMQRWETDTWVDRLFSTDSLPVVNSTTGVFGTTIAVPRVTVNNKGFITNILQQNIRGATTSQTGVVQLNDTITSVLTNQAATPNAVRQANLRVTPQTLSGTSTNQMSETGHSHALQIATDGEAENGTGNGLVTPPKVKLHIDSRITDDTEADSSELLASSKLVKDLGNSKVDNSLIGKIITRNWVSESAAEANQWWAITWSPELSLFVAVALDGTNRVMTSPDGFNWTARAAAEPNNWTSVTWSSELNLFVAVSNSGTNRVMTSPDGINWTARNAATSSGWFSVAWSPDLGLFVAVASSGTNRVMTSPDGFNWTARNAAEANPWRSVVWSPELSLFVAVSSNGTNRVMTSPDGINWTARNAEASSWYSVTWSPELSLFVAVALDGTNRVMTSPDGFNWTARAAAEPNQWYSVTWSSELNLFVAVAATGTNRVMTSPDGINWTVRAAPSGSWRSVAWSPELNLFVAVAFDGTNRVMRTL